MSVLPNQASITLNDRWDVLNTANASFISTINVYNGSVNTGHIQLDQVGMDCAILNSTPTLLLNGVPVGATSNFTSSITQWASYPALAPITYNTGAGTGGTINMANVNALSNVSSLTANFSNLTAPGTVSLAGYTIPMTPGNNIVSALSSTTVITSSGQIITTDFTGQPAGFYMIKVTIQSASADPFTCGFILTNAGGVTTGGGCHMPSFNPYGSQPTTANMIVCQSLTVASPLIDLIFFSNGQQTSGAGILGASAIVSVYRLV